MYRLLLCGLKVLSKTSWVYSNFFGRKYVGSRQSGPSFFLLLDGCSFHVAHVYGVNKVFFREKKSDLTTLSM